MFWFSDKVKEETPDPKTAPWSPTNAFTRLFLDGYELLGFSNADEFQLKILRTLLVILVVNVTLILYAWNKHGQRISERFVKAGKHTPRASFLSEQPVSCCCGNNSDHYLCS